MATMKFEPQPCRARRNQPNGDLVIQHLEASARRRLPRERRPRKQDPVTNWITISTNVALTRTRTTSSAVFRGTGVGHGAKDRPPTWSLASSQAPDFTQPTKHHVLLQAGVASVGQRAPGTQSSSRRNLPRVLEEVRERRPGRAPAVVVVDPP